MQNEDAARVRRDPVGAQRKSDQGLGAIYTTLRYLLNDLRRGERASAVALHDWTNLHCK